MELKADPKRQNIGETGIFVRAKNTDDKWAAVDIVSLDKESLLMWLRSRGGKNEWAENTVGVLLGHDESIVEEKDGH